MKVVDCAYLFPPSYSLLLFSYAIKMFFISPVDSTNLSLFVEL